MSEQTVTASDEGFTITRTFAAPPAKVWETWTSPEHFERWFGVKPGSAELDVRSGGPWRATFETPNGDMTTGGEYREVVPEQKLVWTLETPGELVVMAASFNELDGETVAVYEQNVVAPYSCDESIEGATGILDSFENYLAAR